jgi:3',5'-cyclic AMP phosphodiesterase CpdA
MIEIVHISDLHFGGKDDRTRRVRRLLKNILAAFPFGDHDYARLLITGDIIDNWSPAKNAWKDQYKCAEEALAPFKSKISIVPGNHDYGFGGFGYSRDCVDYFDNQFLPALGIRHHFRTRRPFHEVLDDGGKSRIQLIGLNSCLMTSNPLRIARGEIGRAQRDLSKDWIKDPRYKGVPKIVYLHHIPHRRARGAGMSLTDYRELMTLLENKVEALAFGHEGALKGPRRRSAQAVWAPLRLMRIRRARHYNIKYYLDANACVEQQSCYDIRVEGPTVTARLVKL